MSFIAMNTNNPLGQRPYQQMGAMGDVYNLERAQRSWIIRDFPGAPISRMRTPPELLSGNATKQGLIHPPAIIRAPSPWDAEESVMLLGDAAVTSTQTVVPTTDTTPITTGAVASGQPVSWFTQQTLIPGIDNLATVGGILALGAFIAMFGGKH